MADTAYVPSPLPLSRRLVRGPAHLILRLLGWRIGSNPPPIPKYVLIGAPHTSNWDGYVALLTGLATGVKITILAKDSWFRWPIGPVFRWLGGIPIDRSKSMDMAQRIQDLFDESETLVLAIAPEGTRRKVQYWKAGFYEIAEKAGVPLVLGYFDFGKKEVGFGPVVPISGDIEADMVIIREFYEQVEACNPELVGPIRLRPYVPRARARAGLGPHAAPPAESAPPADSDAAEE